MLPERFELSRFAALVPKTSVSTIPPEELIQLTDLPGLEPEQAVLETAVLPITPQIYMSTEPGALDVQWTSV